MCTRMIKNKTKLSATQSFMYSCKCVLQSSACTLRTDTMHTME